MKKINALIGGIFFSTSILLQACAGAPDDGFEYDEASAVAEPDVSSLSGWSEPEAPPPDYHSAVGDDPAMNDCGCGDLIDENEDGICDRAAEGSCRRGINGRCPCGMGCPGGGC